jgi:hypothetical protein
MQVARPPPSPELCPAAEDSPVWPDREVFFALTACFSEAMAAQQTKTAAMVTFAKITEHILFALCFRYVRVV